MGMRNRKMEGDGDGNGNGDGDGDGDGGNGGKEREGNLVIMVVEEAVELHADAVETVVEGGFLSLLGGERR